LVREIGDTAKIPKMDDRAERRETTDPISLSRDERTARTSTVRPTGSPTVVMTIGMEGEARLAPAPIDPPATMTSTPCRIN
jgi:hypothetical protein